MNNPPKITYILGAGASFNALPIVNELPSVAKGMINYINFSVKNIFNHGYEKQVPTFNKTNELIKEVSKHFSIDTLARKIWIKNKDKRSSEFDEEYFRIVNLITAILYFNQINKTPQYDNFRFKLPERNNEIELTIDPRYEAFFAAILNDDCTIPDNFNFISWNYDFQIEKTLQYYNSLIPIKKTANNYNINYLNYLYTNHNCQIIKLNGTSFFVSNNETIDKLDYDIFTQKHLVNALSDNVEDLKQITSLIHFAWEKESNIINHHKIASQKIKESDFIVIIGYSFPIFNRKVDISLFNDFHIGNTKKIFIQAPTENVNQYIEQLDSIKPGLSKMSTPITNLEQFYIPNEYWAQPKKNNRIASSYG